MKQVIDIRTTDDKETRRQGGKETSWKLSKRVSPSLPLLVSLSALAAQLWYSLLWCVCLAISKVWFRYRYCGRANVPSRGPVLLVANHQSHLDPVLVGIACPRQLKYLARHDLFFWPFGWWIRALGAVPIDRQRGAVSGMKTTLKLLQQNEAVLVFPEGSRTYDGKLQELRPGFCLLARRSGATIVPVAIDGAFKSMRRGSSFPQPADISLAFAAPITAAEFEPLSDKQLVRRVESQIAQSLAYLPILANS